MRLWKKGIDNVCAFVERAERLIKKGVERHEAYWTAIAEHAPNLHP